MTLVIETDPDIRTSADSALGKALSGLGLPVSPRESLELSGHFFHYYTVDAPGDSNELIRLLMEVPGIRGAYLKEDGAPPL